MGCDRGSLTEVSKTKLTGAGGGNRPRSQGEWEEPSHKRRLDFRTGNPSRKNRKGAYPDGLPRVPLDEETDPGHVYGGWVLGISVLWS